MGKRKDIYKMNIIVNIQMMWDKIGATEDTLSLDELLELTYDELWERQMDIAYLYNKFIKERDANDL